MVITKAKQLTFFLPINPSPLKGTHQPPSSLNNFRTVENYGQNDLKINPIFYLELNTVFGQNAAHLKFSACPCRNKNFDGIQVFYE